jgi:hypothetical protein
VKRAKVLKGESGGAAAGLLFLSKASANGSTAADIAARWNESKFTKVVHVGGWGAKEEEEEEAAMCVYMSSYLQPELCIFHTN